MTQAKLNETLSSIVREYGFEQVNQSLREIGLSECRTAGSEQSTAQKNGGGAAGPRRRTPTLTASEHVSRMELPTEKREGITELARRFEDKSFLPTFGDIANFCQIHGIDIPASKSRASAIPRVFRALASMDADDVRWMLDEGLFSGPSRLGPIADAIRRSGRARRSFST
jgi:hypothetical protein